LSGDDEGGGDGVGFGTARSLDRLLQADVARRFGHIAREYGVADLDDDGEWVVSDVSRLVRAQGFQGC
jgi:hypothetical protein